MYNYPIKYRLIGEPHKKIEPRNLARAKELYAAKNNTIAEIMQMTGFKSRNTFYKYVVNATVNA